MQEAFKIWIDRLGEGKVQKIEESFDPSFLEIAENHLVIRLKASTKVTVPCVICNEMIDAELNVENFYHTEAVSEIRDALFDLSAPLREALLIELPSYFECEGGNCSQRQTLEPYLRSTLKSDKKDTHLPFADL